MISLDEYKESILNNLFLMSRTAVGIVDLSSSKTKADSMLIVDGQKAKDIAISNFIKTIEYCYENKDKKFHDTNELKSFLQDIALKINDGIVIKDKLYRNGQDSNKYKYSLIKDIPVVLDKYLNLLLECIDLDPIKAAALSEFYINFRGHFFSDGCGKTSMMMSAYCLMRKDIKVASYISKDEYYKHEPLTYNDDESDFKRFYDYFKSLHR